MSSVRRWVLTYFELETAVHGFLLQLKLERFSFHNGFVVVWVLAQEPRMEFLVLVTDELQSFRDDIGRGRLKKLCILCKLVPCIVVEPQLYDRGFGLLWWCF